MKLITLMKLISLITLITLMKGDRKNLTKLLSIGRLLLLNLRALLWGC
jgi:hypothetical protein